jgi:hypothetical protein
VNDDRGYSDCGQARQTGFQWRITRIASCVAHAMAIGADDRLDKVWIVERSSRSLEARIMWFCAAMATSSALRSRWRDSSVIMMLGLAWLGLAVVRSCISEAKVSREPKATDRSCSTAVGRSRASTNSMLSAETARVRSAHLWRRCLRFAPMAVHPYCHGSTTLA